MANNNQQNNMIIENKPKFFDENDYDTEIQTVCGRCLEYSETPYTKLKQLNSKQGTCDYCEFGMYYESESETETESEADTDTDSESDYDDDHKFLWQVIMYCPK